MGPEDEYIASQKFASFMILFMLGSTFAFFLGLIIRNTLGIQ